MPAYPYDAAGEDALLTLRRGAGPFNRPTRVEAPNCDLYVTDGYVGTPASTGSRPTAS